MSRVRTILAVTRPAILPTVWSNCLAGWWLGGAGHLGLLPLLLVGASLLYFGGVFLNEAFDADFDHEHYPERPVPSGSISQQTSWRIGVALLVVGGLLLVGGGFGSGLAGLVLVFLVVLYNALHRLLPVGAALNGISRLVLYLLGASLAEHGVGGSVIWCGAAVALYVAGTGYFSDNGQRTGETRKWPLLLMVVPVGLALVINAGRYRETGLLLSAVFVLWGVRSLRPALWSLQPNLKATASGLLAGIVFADWLSACPANFINHADHAAQQISAVFLALFAATLLLQRFRVRR